MTLAFDLRTTFTATGAEPFTVAAAAEVRDGETLVVLGPSGSGKTLLLETIAGFHDPDPAPAATADGGDGDADAAGVRLDGRDLTALPPERRGFGFVFQDYALFPHMTVRENVTFGQRYSERDAGDALPAADDLLASFGVSHLAEREPPTLSGGESQRVALARALAVDPDALLLDEPLSALDVPTRQSLRTDLADALADVTAVHVTHDRTTARALADRIAVMRDGRVVQTGPPEAVFESPASRFVARFTGANCLRTADLPDAEGGVDAPYVAIRPERVRLDAADAATDADANAPATATTGPTFEATVERAVREDAAFRVTLAAGEETVEAFAADAPAVGDRLRVALPTDHLTSLSE